MAKRIKVKLPAGWRAEPVNPRMRKACGGCGEVPEGCRLTHTVDSYPFPTSATYCVACGIASMRHEVQAAEALIRDFEVTYGKS